MPMKKTKSFICVEMLEEGSKFFLMFFWCFQVENKVVSIYKISCLHESIMKNFKIH